MTSRAEGSAAGATPAALPIVAHSMRKFLPMSQNWIYSQIVHLRRFQPVVITNQTMNEGAFPLPAERLHVIPRRHRAWAEKVSSLLHLGRDTPSYWRRALGAIRPALVHSHFGNRGYFDLEVVRILGVPQVVTFYGHDLSRLPKDPDWARRFQELFQCATLFTVEGSHMKRTLASLGCPEPKIRVRRHGVELESFEFCPRRVGADGVVRILVAARFVEKKGVPVALRAIAEVARRNPRVALTLVGDANANDPAGQEIKREVAALLGSTPLQQCSRWLGSISFQEFRRLASEHHVYVQASQHSPDGDSEGGAPVTLIQLAASGMPIVSTRHCDIPEVVLDGVTGVLAPEGDVAALAAALEKMVAAPESWPIMGEQARRHVERVFEMSRTIDDLEAIYIQAVEAAS